jgi:cytochrome b involved in lipid metabolism
MLSTQSSEAEGCTALPPQTWKTISRAEVQQHTTLQTGVWLTYKNGVYDVTSFLQNHPGGAQRLLEAAGSDIGPYWNTFRHHKGSSLANQLLEGLKIGELSPEEVEEYPQEPHVAQYDPSVVYDVIVVGAGLSGLQCASSLVTAYQVPAEKILLLEAQDYVGGRVKQMHDFIPGTKIEVGAEFLHGMSCVLIIVL